MTRRSDDWAGTPEYHREIRRARAIQFAIGGAALACFALMFCVVAKGEEVAGARIVIIDGDTVAIGAERIRILNIDAPESFRSRCMAELVAGLDAKERLAELLRPGPVSIDRCEASGRCKDAYGRTLARLSVAGRDVGEVLVAEGRALPWKPGKAAREARLAHWCGGRS